MDYSRRKVVRLGGIAAGSSLLPAQVTSSRKVRLGVIGSGNRGQALMRAFTRIPEVEITAISDVNEPVMDEAQRLLDQLPGRFHPARAVNYEDMLGRRDVDAVLIATPEHWHGLPCIHACQAGKHVYVEKPVSHNVVEGRRMVQAVREHGVIAMAGTQQRGSAHFRRAVEIVQSGRLGRVIKVHCWNNQKSGTRFPVVPDSDPPGGLHWDRWLGPARFAPFNTRRLEHRLWMDYGGSYMTDWGVHHMDIILWAMNAGSPEYVSCSARRLDTEEAGDAPDFIEAIWDFPGFIVTYSYSKFSDFHWARNRPYDHGICFYGSEATLILDRFGFDVWTTPERGKDGVQAQSMPRENMAERTNVVGLDAWSKQFVEAVRDGRPSPVDIEQSHRATVACLLANIAWQTGRRLRWRAEDETIVNDTEASARLSEQARRGYELPKKV